MGNARRCFIVRGNIRKDRGDGINTSVSFSRCYHVEFQGSYSNCDIARRDPAKDSSISRSAQAIKRALALTDNF